MKDEINAAVTFLIRIISGSNNQLSKQQTDDLQEKITQLLTSKFHNHWHPDRPSKGQAFRCIRVNSLNRNDTVLESACQSIGITYGELKIPIELTLWIDPEEVTCRFGEHKGSYCMLAKFKGSNKENYVNQVDINDLEQKAIERQKQASYDLMNSKKKKYIKNNFKTNTTLASIRNNTNAYDIPATTCQSIPTTSYYASSPNTKFYSTSPLQMQYQTNANTNGQQQTNSSGLFSPNRIASYRNFNNTSSYMNVSKSMIRNLRTSFDSINGFNEPVYLNQAGPADRFHWMNKSIVKA